MKKFLAIFMMAGLLATPFTVSAAVNEAVRESIQNMESAIRQTNPTLSPDQVFAAAVAAVVEMDVYTDEDLQDTVDAIAESRNIATISITATKGLNAGDPTQKRGSNNANNATGGYNAD